MNVPNISSDNMSQPPYSDVPSECAEFEILLANAARDLGEVRPEKFEEAMEACLRKLVWFIGFDRGIVWKFAGEKNHLIATYCWACEGVPPVIKGTMLDEDLWYVRQIRSGHIVRISTALDWPVEAAMEREYVREYGIKSTISIPLIIDGTVNGVLTFGTYHKERTWSREMVSRLRLVGEIIALGIRRQNDSMELSALASSTEIAFSCWKDRMRRLAFGLMHAENKERQRISELLHEDIMQIIALVGMHIDVHQNKYNAGSRSTANINTKELIQAVLRKLQNLAAELRCDVLSKKGLAEGLQLLVLQMRQMYNLSVGVQVYGEIKNISNDVHLFIHRAVSKLIENVAMHSQTRQALVEVRHELSCTKITVSDEGVGFELDSLEDIPHKSFGLFSIREQVELLGGELQIASSSGHGTRVTLAIPDSSSEC